MKNEHILIILIIAIIAIVAIIFAIGVIALLCFVVTNTPTTVDNVKQVERDQTFSGSLASYNHVDLTVSDVNGNVEVRAGNGDAFAIDVYEKGTEAGLQRYYVDYSQSSIAGNKTISLIVRDNMSGIPTNSQYSADIIVTVPGNMSYSMNLADVNGDIMSGPFYGTKSVMTNVNGRITSAFSADEATFSDVNGDVDVTTSKTAGRINADNVNGGIEVSVPEDAGYSLSAHVVNGGIVVPAHLNTTENSRFAVIGSTPGYAGNGLRLDLTTVNGRIAVNTI